jgi:hypothetical protein
MNITPTLVKSDDKYYLVMSDGELTLEEALEQNKACLIDSSAAFCTGLSLLNAYQDMLYVGTC